MDVTLPQMPDARRVTVVAHELRGFHPVGGMGTATTFLALALARLGHSVEILLGKHAPQSIDPTWRSLYDDAGIGIRPVPRTAKVVEPWHFAHAHAVSLGLQESPPDVVVAHDFGAPAYTALRLRQAGIAFDNTLFVVYCHGPRRWIADINSNVAIGDLPTVLGVSVLEQAAVELADVVVSPSAHLLAWMNERGWRLPEQALVIPYFTRAEATGKPADASSRQDGGQIRRLSFFGRVDERKGVKLLVEALNGLDPARLDGLELEFVGKTTSLWPRARVLSLLSDATKRALAGVSFMGDLDQPQALARLKRPGTLAVIPSLHDNSPNTIYECLEERIPFIASNTGGAPELIVPEDHGDVLFDPTPEALASVLERVLASGNVPALPRRAFAAGTATDRWAEVLAVRPQPRGASVTTGEAVDAVVVRRASQDALLRCVAALGDQTHDRVETIVADTRQEGLEQGGAPYVLFLDEDDVPDPDLVKTLLAARAATGADVVTCGLQLEDRLRFFAGDPRGLGAVTNAYGNIALFRREVLEAVPPPARGARDADWPVLAGLAAAGASLVSVPAALVGRAAAPGSAEDDPAAALAVVQQLERALPDPLRDAARIAAGLAAGRWKS
jgi:glycosyltransferase involved in cell wall biosynthesis